MKIDTLVLGKEGLEKLNDEERAAVLLIGHSCNQINVLQKIIMVMLSNPTGEVKIVEIVEAGQCLIILRLLIGKLHEAGELFRIRFQRSKHMREKILSQLDKKTTANIKTLNKEFGNKSALTSIRNSFSFHSADKYNLVEASFHRIDRNESWEFYLSPSPANVFYYACGLVVTRAAIDLMIGDDIIVEDQREGEGLRRMCKLSLSVALQVTDLFSRIVFLIIQNGIRDAAMCSDDIGEVAKASQLTFPYFLDEEDLTRSALKSKSTG